MKFSIKNHLNKVVAIIYLSSSTFIYPNIALADSPTGIKKIIINFINFILDTFVGFLIAASIVFFLFNTIRYFIIDSANEEGRSKAKRLAIYGIFALLIISIFIPLITLLVSSLNFGNNNPVVEDYVTNG